MELGATTRPKRILAIASGGGHWVQLKRLLPALEGHELIFVTVHAGYRHDVPDHRFYRVHDANRWNKLGLLLLALEVAWVLLRERPDVVISTGAAPGYFGLRLGKLLRARTIWVDSVANVETLSLSGKLAGGHADLWLTQWSHLATPGGPRYEGSVL